MKQRHCNVYGCTGIMRPTRKMWDLDGKLPNPDHRIFKCNVCGKENPWLDKPIMNGYFGELHMTKNGASGLSLMSDPVFCKPKNPILATRKRRR